MISFQETWYWGHITGSHSNTNFYNPFFNNTNMVSMKMSLHHINTSIDSNIYHQLYQGFWTWEICYSSLIYAKGIQIRCLIYHRPSPKKDLRGNRQRNSSSTSFQDFQDSVSDAWDIGDDEFCIISGTRLNNLFLLLKCRTI